MLRSRGLGGRRISRLEWKGACLEVWAPTQNAESFYRVGTQLDLGRGAKERWRRRFQNSGTCENLIVCRQVKLRRLRVERKAIIPLQSSSAPTLSPTSMETLFRMETSVADRAVSGIK
jgi:hypothetical protein